MTQINTNASLFVTRQMPLPLSGFGFGASNNALSDLFSGLAQAFQGLAEMIGGGKPAFTGGGLSFLDTSDGASMKPIAGKARIWGDPHFIGADGGKFDVQGQAGKTYNLLSDKGFQMNGEFHSWRGDKKQTVVGKVGITAGANYVEVHKDGKAIVNGRELKDGERVPLRDGGYVEKRGANISVKKGEWEVDFQTHRDHINMDIKTDNAVADGVRPHGLIGQTFDGDGKARNGDSFAGAQGGGAIEDANGNITRRGDTSAIKGYEVDALWDTTFGTHNRDHANVSAYTDMSRESTRFLMMSSFSTLASSLFGNQMNWGWGSNYS